MAVPILFLLVFIAIVYFLQTWSINNALKGVEYKREVSKVLNAPGEPFTLITTITNTSFRLIPFVSVQENLTSEISHKFTVYLKPRSILVRSVEASLPARGRYFFSKANIYGGDFLGINERREEFRTRCEIVVYPQEARGNYLDRVTGSFLGDISVSRFIVPDPTLVIGFDVYTGREPMKSISWPQTLRAGQMMVKKYDYTTEVSATVVLSLDYLSDSGFKLPDGAPELIEKCLSIARTICETLNKRNIRYDFFSNISSVGRAGAWDYVNEGLGSKHLSHILEGLGRATHYRSETLDKLALRVSKRQMVNKSVIFIVPNDEDKAMQIIRQAGKEIRSVTVIAADRLGG
ncbi:MAG: DUF58 domain-containing protein [Firmicutes bacterium]|nr:DUF58 domain-containing protein [Bacillota bacterium]